MFMIAASAKRSNVIIRLKFERSYIAARHGLLDYLLKIEICGISIYVIRWECEPQGEI